MRLLRCRLSIAALAVAFLMTAGAPRASHANWEGAIASPTTFFARWSYVPDFDQRRLLLPSQGAMYCVPTSAMNWMAYIAHHGYPGVNPPGDHSIYHWQSDLAFNDVTNYVFDMGEFMDTSETEGTEGAEGVNGINTWLAGKGFSYLIYDYGVSGDFVPRHGHISDWTLYKCPVILGIGWYSNNAPPPGFPPELTLIVREGGHATSLVEVARSGNDREVGFRDPASDNSNQPFGIAIQSPATTESYAMEAEQIYLNAVGVRTMDKIADYGSGWLDGYTVIVPVFGLTTVDDSLKLGLHKPNPWSWDDSSELQVIDFGASTPIIGVRQIPGTPEAAIICDEETDPETGARIPPKISRVNLVTGEVTEIGSFNDPTQITFGRDRRMYVLDGFTVRCINIDADPPIEEASVNVNGDPSGIAYKDFNDTVLVYSPGLTRLFEFDKTLNADTVQFWDLPPDEIALDGQTFITSFPDLNIMLITSEGSQAAYRLIPSFGGGITVSPVLEGELFSPQSLNIGDDRTLFISEDGVLRVFPPDPIDGGWLEDPSSPFAGLVTNGVFDYPSSRTNVDPPAPGDSAWFHVLPTEFAEGVVDCIHMDADASGFVDFGDLTIVLGNWLNDYTPGTGPGDADADGVVDFGDVTTILGNWLAPCP